MDKGSTSSQLVIGNGAAKAPVTKFNVCTGRPPRCSPGVQENEALKAQLRERDKDLEENEALKAQLRERDKDLEEMEKKLWEKDEEILFLKVVLEKILMRNYTTTTKIHTPCEANMDLVVSEEDMLIHSLERTLEGTETMRNQQNTHCDNNSAVQTLEEENKVLKAKLRELEKNLKRREERIREKEDEVRSIKVRITEEATRNRRTEEELRNKKRELERIKVDLERTQYAKRTAEEVKVLSPEVQRCEVRINEVKEEWSGAKGKVMRGKVRDIEVVIKEPLSTKLEAFKAFKRESDIISQLDHPNVVRCHATFDKHYNQSPWIVLEYANGVSLGYHLNKRLFTLVPFEVLSFALDAGRGLLYLHTLPSPIVHGDLHSGNLLLFIIGSTPPVLKLCDFGKATILGNTMPPNQGPSKKDDVLSFGKLLSDMLLKIKWPDWMARQEQVYFRTSLEQLIERCTKEIPESRPDMQKVVDDLKDLENRYSNFPGQVEQDPVEKYLITKTSFNRH